jgi:hypothetical protein
MASYLKQLQDDIVGRIQSDPFFASITVLPEYLNDIQNQIDIAIAKIGICVVVSTPSARTSKPNIPGPIYDDIPIVIKVGDIPTLNSTGIPAIEAAEKIASVLHHWFPTGYGIPLQANGDVIGVLRAEDDQGNLITQCEIHFKAQGGIIYDITATGTPVLTYDAIAGTVTMTCVTPGAAIFYSEDAYATAPRTGTVYTGPVIVAAGHLVVAQAWLSGYLPSAQATINT